jgi:hypothetical protein
MPSYRLELEIGDLRPGRTPNQVMEAVLSSLEHHIDATDITVIDGTPRILVRFTVPASSAAGEDTAAQVAVRHTREAVQHIASTGGASTLAPPSWVLAGARLIAPRPGMGRPPWLTAPDGVTMSGKALSTTGIRTSWLVPDHTLVLEVTRVP